jgi:Ca2+-transporting ATPase
MKKSGGNALAGPDETYLTETREMGESMMFEKQPWHARPVETVLAALESSPAGLSEAEAARRLKTVGANELPRQGGEGPWRIFWRQVNNPIGWLLIAAGCIAVLMNRQTDAAVVFGAVVINSIIGFIQEYRAGKAIEELATMVPESAAVLREGAPLTVLARQLVPGDLVALQSGDRVPADLRLIRTKNLLVQEAALTGESLPVAKHTEQTLDDVPLGDRLCMAYNGTMVMQGTATGVVVHTGGATELGRINEMLGQTVQLETPLTKQLAKVSAGITLAVVAGVVIFIAFGVLVKNASLGDALMVAVALAVAAIPEGLPAVITIALAIGVRRMAARHAVVRHLPAVETLGATSVICSDKTGTLTRNEMTVQAVWMGGHEYRVSGVGYDPDGDIEHDGMLLEELPQDLEDLLTIAALCNDAVVRQDGHSWVPTGDPTEAALVVAARKGGLAAEELRERFPRLDVIPFESESQFMATLHSMDGRPQILLKGAPETVMQLCLLDEAGRKRIAGAIETYARQGMRLIAFARKEGAADDRLQPGEEREGFAFAGMVGMIDPPRSEAVDAIRVCHRAGITVKMITGDHPVTAEAIGRQLGLLGPAARALRGRDLDGLTEEQLRDAALNTNVFARVAPEHKLRLVEVLQAGGGVVAMTGDGVNDAPALKRADIGVAMGITGTSVSKEAAKVVLMDDNFASIAAAVEEGRRVYDNLIKSLAFILPTNLALAGILAVAMFFFPTVVVDGVSVLLMALSPTQILWINLVASVTLSVPLAFEPLEPNAMQRQPRSPGEPVFSWFILYRLVIVAAVMVAGGCGLFLWEYFRIIGDMPVTAAIHSSALAQSQTICVTVVTLSQIFYLLNCRSLRDSIFAQGVFTNPAIFVSSGVLLLLHFCFMYLPPLQSLFGSVALDARSWMVAILAGFSILPIISLEKWRRRVAANGTP